MDMAQIINMGFVCGERSQSCPGICLSRAPGDRLGILQPTCRWALAHPRARDGGDRGAPGRLAGRDGLLRCGVQQGRPTFIESAAALRAVLAQLQREHGFEPPTDPGLRFLRKGLASAEGYLAWPTSGGKAAEPFWSSLFGTEAQALDLVHWRVPPAGGSCIPVQLGDANPSTNGGRGYSLDMSWTRVCP